jgi:hypothetical protein
MSKANFRSILAVVTDPFSAEQPAALKAAALARRCYASPDLVERAERLVCRLGKRFDVERDRCHCDVLVIKPRGFKTSVPRVRPR